MWKHASSIAVAGASLARRSASDSNQPPTSRLDFSAVGIIFTALTILAFLPVLVAAMYTLGSIYPTLAIIEDPSPPAYEPVAVHEDVESNANPNKLNSTSPYGQPKLITSSIRSMGRLLKSLGGWPSFFRGFGCAAALVLAKGFMEALLSGIPFIPSFVGALISDLALVQLYTAWVHIVISQPSDLPFYRRLPPLKKTFEATSLPIFIVWLASIAMVLIPGLIAYFLNLPFWDPTRPNEIPTYKAHHAWIVIFVFLLGLCFLVFAIIPATVVLTRVQASLLPPEEDAIVPFDRSFGGSVDPAIVGGPGYVSWKGAWKTVSRASWIRLYKLFAKVWAITFFLHIVFFVVFLGVIGLGATVN